MISVQQNLKYKDLIIFEKITIQKGSRRIPKQFKEEEACFMFLQKGNFIFRTPTDTIKFKKGDVMLSKCGNYFFEPNEKGENVTGISAYFYPKLVKSFIDDDFNLNELLTPFDTKNISVNPILQACIDSIMLLFNNPTLASNNMVITKLKELLILLSKSEQATSIHKFILSLFDPIEYRFENIIQNNLYSNLTIAEFSHLCGMSISSFNRKFKAIYKSNPTQYFLSKKLERATQLLIIDSKPVFEVAMDCGFNSISYFNTTFKKSYGVTPTNYRMNVLSK